MAKGRQSQDNGSNGALAEELGSQWNQALGQQQREWLHEAQALTELGMQFWNDRWSAAAAYFDALQRCESPNDVAALNTEFVSSTMAEWSSQTQRMLGLAMRRGPTYG